MTAGTGMETQSFAAVWSEEGQGKAQAGQTGAPVKKRKEKKTWQCGT
jgi:hypothetical protein